MYHYQIWTASDRLWSMLIAGCARIRSDKGQEAYDKLLESDRHGSRKCLSPDTWEY